MKYFYLILGFGIFAAWMTAIGFGVHSCLMRSEEENRKNNNRLLTYLTHLLNDEKEEEKIDQVEPVDTAAEKKEHWEQQRWKEVNQYCQDGLPIPGHDELKPLCRELYILAFQNFRGYCSTKRGRRSMECHQFYGRGW